METASQFVFEATTANFEETVLTRSHEVPGLVLTMRPPEATTPR